MSDDIRAWTAELAADPSSLIFLRLGEALRRRGQLEAAEKVAVAGLSRYPHLPDAHDLYARILTDAEDLERAFDEWDMVLRLDPTHPGALKGLGFLYYRAGEQERALEHLDAALSAMPDDVGLRVAVERLQEILGYAPPDGDGAAAPAPSAEATAVEVAPGPFGDLEPAEDHFLLVDAGGLRLAGGLSGVRGEERIAALVASTTREAARFASMLDLGEWQTLLTECTEANVSLTKPTEETFLIGVGDSAMPLGQLGLMAERAGVAARDWLGGVR